MGTQRFVVEVLIDKAWVRAHRIAADFENEALALKAAKKHYPLTCQIQARRGPVGLRIVPAGTIVNSSAT